MALSITLSQTGISSVADTLQGAKVGAPITVAIPTLLGASYTQELLGKPAGSSATIGAGASATFTPDKIGSYRGRSKRTLGASVESAIWIVRVQRNALGQVEGLGAVSPAPDEASTEGGTDPYPTRWEKNLEALSPRGGTFAPPLVLTGNKQYDLSSLFPVVVSFASSGHENGATATLLIRPYTAPTVSLPVEANVTGPAFDPAYGYRIEVSHFGGVFRTFTSTMKSPDLSPPEILWVHVMYENARKVEIKFDKPAYIADKNAIFFSGADVESIISGDGTDTIVLLTSAANDPSVDDLTLDVDSIKSMWGVSIRPQVMGLHWRISPDDPTLQMTGYKDTTVTLSSTAFGIWALSPYGLKDPNNWSNESQPPTYTDPAIDGEPGMVFNAVQGDVTRSSFDLSALFTSNSGSIWLCTWPGRWAVGGTGLPAHTYSGLVEAGGAVGITCVSQAGADNNAVDFLHYSDALPGYFSLLAPAVPRQPALFRMTWSGGLKRGKVGDRNEVSGAFGGLPSWYNTQTLGIGGWGVSDRSQDQTFVGILTCKVGHTDPAILEGVNSHFMRLPHCRFMRPQPTIPPRFLARVGQALVIPWGAIMLYPNAPGSADYTWLSFSVSGLSGATTTTRALTWTPGAVGEYDADVTISMGGKVIRNFSIHVEVLPASTSGNISVCLIGDSWTDGGGLGELVCLELEAMGHTVTMLGSRGGYAVTAIDVGTNILTVTNPGIVNTGDPIEIFDSAGKIPAGLGAAYTTLYAEKMDAGPTAIKCRATPGGATIDITNDGWQTFSVNTTTGLITCTGHGWVAQPKAFSRWPILRVRANGGTIPTGLTAGVDYYFEQVDANSGYLCSLYKGARVIPSTVGAGSFQIGPAYLHVRTPKQRHEGRGGWSLDHYLSAVGNPVAGPGPFQDPVTDLYSWPYFKAQNLGGVAPDITIHQLGINGGLNSGVYGRQREEFTHHARSTIAPQMQRMISSILTEESTTKTIVAIPALPGCKESMFELDYGATYSQWEWSQAAFLLQEAYRLAFQNREAERIHVASFQVVDTETEFVNSVHPSHTNTSKQLAMAASRAKAAP